MKMVSKTISEIVSVFRDLSRHAQPTSALFNNSSTTDAIIVESQWSQRDLQLGEKTAFSMTHFFSDKSAKISLQSQTRPQERANIQWMKQSPSGKLCAIVKKVKNKAGDNKQYFEIWDSSHKLKNFDIQNGEKHGTVYDPASYGSMEWSSSEQFLLYIAESKVAKSASFFKETIPGAQEKAEEKPEEIIKGNEYLYQDTWGEQLTEKIHPVPCILNIDSGEVTVLDYTADISAMEVCWAPDDAGILVVGMDEDPYRLGRIYCNQRRSRIYHIDLKAEKSSPLTAQDRSVRSIRFNADKSLFVYLDNPAHGAHMQCSRLMKYSWEEQTTSVIIDIVKSQTNIDDFPGIFCDRLPSRVWLPCGRELLFSTLWRSCQVPIIVDVAAKTVKRLHTATPQHCSEVISDVWKNYVLMLSSSPNKLPYMVLGKVEAPEKEWVSIGEQPPLSSVNWEIVHHQPTNERINSQYSNLDYESLLYLPTSTSDGESTDRPPIILFPHGGPHSAFDTQFILYSAAFCQCGYAVLHVNYRGSIGFGQDSVESLLGNIGEQDVKDCLVAAEEVIQTGRVDANRMFVFGGSHGGFLTTHLIGQYPSQFKAAACRNPVIDLTTMVGTSDILDWVFEEAGERFQFKGQVNAEILANMWKRSPLSHIDKVTTPILLIIGKDDKRVPPSQAQMYYKGLKARKQIVRFLAYDDNSHPIISVPAESDCFVNVMLWFGEHME